MLSFPRANSLYKNHLTGSILVQYPAPVIYLCRPVFDNHICGVIGNVCFSWHTDIGLQ